MVQPWWNHGDLGIHWGLSGLSPFERVCKERLGSPRSTPWKDGKSRNGWNMGYIPHFRKPPYYMLLIVIICSIQLSNLGPNMVFVDIHACKGVTNYTQPRRCGDFVPWNLGLDVMKSSRGNPFVWISSIHLDVLICKWCCLKRSGMSFLQHELMTMTTERLWDWFWCAFLRAGIWKGGVHATEGHLRCQGWAAAQRYALCGFETCDIM